MIIYKKGSIADATETIIVHGCNAQGRMNSGVAKVLREKWPELTWDVYSKKHQESGLKVGEVVFGYDDNNRYIANAITQEFYGYDGKLYLSYEGLREALEIIDSAVYREDYSGNLPEGTLAPVAMPRIGAGLAGGDWEIILQIIEESFVNRDVVIYDL